MSDSSLSSDGPKPEEVVNTGAAAWHDGLDLGDEDRDYLAEKGVKSAGDFVASYRELERYQGNSIALPGPDAGDQDWARIHDRLGRPETPENYDFGDLDGIDGRDKAQIDWFRQTSHDLGLSQKQAAELLARFSEFGAKRAAEDQAAESRAAAEAMARLHDEWGPEKHKNNALAERAIKALGLSQDEVDALTAGPAGKVALSRAMARIAPKLGEDRQVGKGANGGLELSRADARARIDAVYDDPDHPYHKASHPGHQAAVDTMRDYFLAADPGPVGS